MRSFKPLIESAKTKESRVPWKDKVRETNAHSGISSSVTSYPQPTPHNKSHNHWDSQSKPSHCSQTNATHPRSFRSIPVRLRHWDEAPCMRFYMWEAIYSTFLGWRPPGWFPLPQLRREDNWEAIGLTSHSFDLRRLRILRWFLCCNRWLWFRRVRRRIRIPLRLRIWLWTTRWEWFSGRGIWQHNCY